MSLISEFVKKFKKPKLKKYPMSRGKLSLFFKGGVWGKNCEEVVEVILYTFLSPNVQYFKKVVL